MGTAIEWTDMVWNPVTGCTKVSEGCRNCYAFALHDMRHKAYQDGKKLPQQYAKPFSEIQLFPDRLLQPLKWRKPRRVFVNSMSDLFHDSIDEKYIAKVFGIMWLAQQHTFQVLTKRPERMYRLLNDEDFQMHIGWFASQLCREAGIQVPTESLPNWPNPNIWLGVSVENQKAADERIPLLLQTPAAVRFLSCEPLLGQVDLNRVQRTDNAYFQQRGETGCLTDPNEPDDYVYWHKRDQIHWVIVGGESGPKARPMHPDWVRSIRDQCQAAGVAFFFKQWGEWVPNDQEYGANPGDFDYKKKHVLVGEDEVPMCRAGKKKAGRLLDGREWNEFPGGERDAN